MRPWHRSDAGWLYKLDVKTARLSMRSRGDPFALTTRWQILGLPPAARAAKLASVVLARCPGAADPALRVRP